MDETSRRESFHIDILRVQKSFDQMSNGRFIGINNINDTKLPKILRS